MRRWPIALAFLVPIGAATAAADAAEEEPDAARELAQVVERLNALDVWLDQAGQHLASRQKALQSADRRVAAAAGRIRDLGGRIGAAEAALVELDRERETLAEERELHTHRVAEHARAAWRLAGDDVAKLILNQQDPAAVERVLRYHAHLADTRAAAADALAETLADLDRNAAERRREAESLRQARSELAAGQRALVAERDRQRQVVAGLEADVDAKRQERERLLASQQRLQQLVDALAARKLPGPSGAGLGQAGRLPWPVEGRVQANFGEPRAGGRMRWQGMVIAAPQGAAVRTVASGRVAFADWLRGFGMLAIVDHGDGYLSLYGHADTLYKSADDRVEAGETIAAVGRSGGQDQIGLYFEIRKGGVPVDPRAWLRTLAAGG